AEIPVNEAVAFEVTEEVANFGPAGPVLAEVYEVLFPPESCAASFHATAALLALVESLEVAIDGVVVSDSPADGDAFQGDPGAPVSIRFGASLSDGQTLELSEQWDILCTQLGEQDFEFVKVVLHADDPSADTNLDNNELERPFSVTVVEADADEPQIVNDLLALLSTRTSFDMAQKIFTIRTTFKNTSDMTIMDPFFEVAILEGAGCPCMVIGFGGVGAQIPINAGGDGVLTPNEMFEHRFDIQLTNRAPFSFFVNVFGVVGP
ncbi:MAG: hypothetical protein L0177_07250, partial [Chloroflexi bacterium]|nr:hypothetical protein [Chloroflexota bacterium]